MPRSNNRRLPQRRGPREEEDERFNQTLGRRQPTTRRAPRTSTPQNRAYRVEAGKTGAGQRGVGIAVGTSKLPTAAEKTYKSWFPTFSGGGLSPETSIRTRLDAVYDDLTREYTERESLINASQEAYFNKVVSNPMEHVEQFESPEAALAAASEATPVTLSNSALGQPASRVLDLLNRPFYGAFEAGRHALEQQYEREDKGDKTSLDTIMADMAYGAGQGLGGFQKTGPGMMLEQMLQESNSGWGQNLRGIKEAHPEVYKWGSRGVGAVGEYYGGKATNISMPKRLMVRGAGGAADEIAGPRSMRGSLRNIMQSEVEEYYDSIVANLAGSQHLPDRQAFVDNVMNASIDVLNNAELPVMGGALAGRYSVMNERMWAQTVANAATNELSQTLTGEFSKLTNDFFEAAKTGKHWHPSIVQAAVNTNDDFSKFVDALDDELVKEGRIPANSSLDDVINAVDGNDKTMLDNIAATIRQGHEPDLDKFFKDVYGSTRNATYTTMGIRLSPNGKVHTAKAVGRAYQGVKKMVVGDTDPFPGRSYNSIAPSQLALMASRAQTVGIYAMDEYKKIVEAFGKQYTKEEGNYIQHIVDNDIDVSANPHLQAGKDFYKAHMEAMFNEEIAFGARLERNTPRLQNYAYPYNKGGAKGKRNEYKTERKKEVAKSKGKHAGPYRMQKARNDKLRPVENAFDALIYRKMKSQRDITRAVLRTDMIDNYGFWSPTIGKATLKSRKIKDVKYSQLSESMRKQIDKDGGAYYLPNDLKGFLDEYYKMTKWNSTDLNQALRFFAKVMGLWKTLSTVTNPGFHVKNQIGDTYMGMIDGVTFNSYQEVSRKYTSRAAGNMPNFHIVEGWDMIYDEAWTKYQKEAQAGFFHVDEGGAVRPSAKTSLTKAARLPGQKLRDWSQSREDFGRFTHFIHALREEAQELKNHGLKDMDQIQRKASDAALFRVNNYRYDYNALTVWEKQLKTLAFPFYTYTRKAIPTMVQSMFENPEWMKTWNRFMTYNDGSAADNFRNWDVPEYIRMTGAAYLTDEREPLYLSQEALPISTLNTFRTNTMEDFASSFVNQANPFVQMPFELAGDKTFFDEREIESTGDYLLNKLPMFRDIKEEIVDPLTGAPSQEKGAPLWEDIMRNRLAGFGLPIRRVSQGQQESTQNEWIDKTIDDPLRQINFAQDIFRVKRDPTTGYYEVRSSLQLDENGQNAVVAMFNLPQEAIAYVEQNLPKNYRKPTTYTGLDPRTGTGVELED